MQGEKNIPAVSVIVPVYHVEKVLRRCLDSLLAQRFSDYEIILVNDGGNEEETAICEEYAAANERIIYRRQENRGLSAARNTGMALAKGRWIMFVDSDDWVHPDFCGKAYEAVEKSGAQIAVFDLAYTNGSSTQGSEHRSQLPEGVIPGIAALKARLTGGIAGYVWNKIYAKELWDGIPFPVGELWEDDAVLYKVIDRAENVAILHDVLYYKPYREGSITDVAFRSSEGDYWLYKQRQGRYLYLQKTHPELMQIESGILGGAALHYAFSLAHEEGGGKKIPEISRWLKEHDVRVCTGGLRRRLTYPLLRHTPRLFALVAKLAPPSAGSRF